MSLEAKILNPVSIRLGKNYNIIMEDEKTHKEYPLIPGVMFGGEHYGFVLITEHNGKQRETVYPTQCKIQAIGINGGILKVFEDGKKLSWRFDKTGKLEHSTFDDFTDEFRSNFDIIVENYDMFMGEPTLMNPLNIKISRNPEESVILKDENIKEDYPLYPGVMLGNVHYGFILIIDTDKGQKEVVYPTQNRIDAVGIEGNIYGDLKVFENGKYHPWLFGYDGKFKKEASYNQYSRRDKAFVEDCYGLNETNTKYCFALQKKK